MKNESLISSSMYGTWTFVTETMTDLGYYKGRAFVVMHLMPDPMQVRSCELKGCTERNNKICQYKSRRDEKSDDKECVSTESTVAEWSDVTAFFQFGFQLRTGIAFKAYTFANTSDWLGPYNMIMAPLPSRKIQKFASRYVTTPASSHLHLPPDAAIVPPEIFDRMVGLTAINQSIHMQQSLEPGQDPFDSYRGTCEKGDIPAGILPRMQLGLSTTTANDDTPPKTTISMLRVDFSMLSIPDPKSKLYKLWPSLQKHLGVEFPLTGPYCYGNDPRRAYAIQLSYDSNFDTTNNETWKVLKGCLPDLPCWSDEAPSAPYDNNASGIHVVDPLGVAALVCYLFGFLLVVSLVFNCQLSNQLKRLQQQRESEQPVRQTQQSQYATTSSGTPIPQQQVFDAFHDLEEPLLAQGSENAEEHHLQRTDGGGAEEFKDEQADD